MNQTNGTKRPLEQIELYPLWALTLQSLQRVSVTSYAVRFMHSQHHFKLAK